MKYSPSASSSPDMVRGFSRNTSPLPAPASYKTNCMSAATKRYKYLRRLFKFDQMDFEFAIWQMIYLFVSPQKVYRNFHYRKQTKSQFARDDPAFLVLLSIWLCVTSIGFAVALGLGFGQFVVFLLYVIFVDFIGCGLIVATLMWYISNKYFRKDPDSADVEWGYAFDVHMNAFFPPLSLLHCFQLLFFYNLLIHGGFLSCLVGNTFWLMSLLYYVYITFLGYSCLPILKNTRLFLFPIPIIIVLYLVITLGFGWNLSLMLKNFYHLRISFVFFN